MTRQPMTGEPVLDLEQPPVAMEIERLKRATRLLAETLSLVAAELMDEDDSVERMTVIHEVSDNITAILDALKE